MTNTALFHELHAAFKNTAGKVNQMEMFQFLTQKENEIMDSGKASRCINNKASLDEGSIKFLCINEHWDSGSGKMAKAVKNSTDLYAALCKLHKKHFPDLCPPKSCNDALANLARFCFCGDHRRFDPELQFDFHGYFCTARTAKRLINRKDILLEIATALEQGGPVILCGEAGIGKTSAVKCFYREYRQNAFCDFFYLPYCFSLDHSIKGLRFKNHNRGEDNWEPLSFKSPDSLLIIDNMDCPPEELAENLERLAKLQLKILIITRTVKVPDKFPTVTVRPMDDALLSALYIQTNPDAAEADGTLNTLFRLLDKNTLAVSLAANLAALTHNTAEGLISLFKNSSFNVFKESPKFKHSYRNNELKFLGHVCKIYTQCMENLPSPDRNLLGIISVFGNSPIPCDLLNRCLTGANQGWIQSMMEMGLLSETAPQTVSMHRLIADAIFIIEKPSYKSCEATISAIQGELANFRRSLNLPDVQEIVHASVTRLLPTVTGYNNAEQKSPSKEQERWWLYVLDCIIYLLSLGECESSAHMLEDIYATRGEGADLTHPYYLFKMTLDLHNDWVGGCSVEKLVSSLNGLREYYSQTRDKIRKRPIGCHSAALGYLMMAVIDKCATLSFQSLLQSAQRQALTESGCVNAVDKGFQLPSEILKLYTQHIQSLCIYASLEPDDKKSGPRLSFLSGDEYEYYGFIYEYLERDVYDRAFLSSLTDRMFEKYSFLGEALSPSARIKYICAMMAFQSVCIALQAVGSGDAAAHARLLNNLQLLKSFLDREISAATLLTKMVFNMSVIAYYFYAFCLSDFKEDISAREKVEECFSKAPNLSAKDKKTVMDGFSGLSKTDLSRPRNAPLPDL